MRALTFLAVLIFAPLADAITQEQPLPEPGQRVRVTAPDLGINRQAATFSSLDGGVLIVTADSTMQRPLADVSRLDVYAGRKSNTLLGGTIGAVVLGLTTTVIVSGVCSETGGCSAGTEVIAGALGFAGGALVGAGIGAFIWTSDEWEEVPLDRLRVSVVPTRNGFGIGARIAF